MPRDSSAQAVVVRMLRESIEAMFAAGNTAAAHALISNRLQHGTLAERCVAAVYVESVVVTDDALTVHINTAANAAKETPCPHTM